MYHLELVHKITKRNNNLTNIFPLDPEISTILVNLRFEQEVSKKTLQSHSELVYKVKYCNCDLLCEIHACTFIYLGSWLWFLYESINIDEQLINYQEVEILKYSDG